MKLQDRWQVRAAIITAAVLYMLLPPKLTFGPGWIAPVVVVVLLVPIAALAPSPRFVKRVRVLSVVLIAVLNALNVASVALLIVDILDTHAKNHGVSAFELIRYGSLVWVTNVIVFGLWYWELDSGGQYARAACATAREFDQPDFLFPQLQMNANNLETRGDEMEEAFDIGARLLVVFDGNCGLCNRAVRWFLVRDRRDRLRFAASESAMAAGLLARHGVIGSDSAPGGIPRTILVVRDPGGSNEKLLVRSAAVLAMLGELPRPWPAVGVALAWIPRPARDLGYRLVARWRYRIWGRLESCPVPTAAERERFL